MRIECSPIITLVPRRERGSGDFAQKPRSLLTFRQEFQSANEIVENSILSLLGTRYSVLVFGWARD